MILLADGAVTMHLWLGEGGGAGLANVTERTEMDAASSGCRIGARWVDGGARQSRTPDESRDEPNSRFSRPACRRNAPLVDGRAARSWNQILSSDIRLSETIASPVGPAIADGGHGRVRPLFVLPAHDLARGKANPAPRLRSPIRDR